MTVMLKSLDQNRYHSIQRDLIIHDRSMMSNNIMSGVKNNNIESPLQISCSPKLSKTRIPRLLRDELTPHFSVKRISELKQDDCDKRTRKKGRKYSDDYELRRRVDTVDPSSMKSVSLEKLSNDSGVWYCVRGTRESPKKKASSVSQPVDRALNQTAKLHRNAAYPRVYRHQPTAHELHQHPHKGYAAMHAAKQALKEQQKQPHKMDRRVEKISKQIDDNKIRIVKEIRCPVPKCDPLQNNKYPHTLPSAMYPPPHPSEYPSLYEPLPPVIDQPHSVKPLPPISTQCEEHNVNTVSTTHPEPSSSPRVSLASTPTSQKKNPQDSYAQPKRLRITYKPYGIRDYNAMKATFGNKAGGLGPDIDNELYKQKLARSNRKLEYAERIREKNLQKEFPKKKASKQYVPPSKTVLANQYARTIAKPRVTKHRQLMPIERLNSHKPPSTSSQDVIEEKLLMNLHHRKIMSDLGHII